jgi:surfactin synthase thioesterase subunit
MSLSGTSGGEPPKALDAKSLAEMSDKDFQALMQTVNGRKQISAIMGE